MSQKTLVDAVLQFISQFYRKNARVSTIPNKSVPRQRLEVGASEGLENLEKIRLLWLRRRGKCGHVSPHLVDLEVSLFHRGNNCEPREANRALWVDQEAAIFIGDYFNVHVHQAASTFEEWNHLVSYLLYGGSERFLPSVYARILFEGDDKLWNIPASDEFGETILFQFSCEKNFFLVPSCNNPYFARTNPIVIFRRNLFSVPIIPHRTRREHQVSLISLRSDSSDGKEDLDEKYENKSRRLIEVKVEYLKRLNFSTNFWKTCNVHECAPAIVCQIAVEVQQVWNDQNTVESNVCPGNNLLQLGPGCNTSHPKEARSSPEGGRKMGSWAASLQHSQWIRRRWAGLGFIWM